MYSAAIRSSASERLVLVLWATLLLMAPVLASAEGEIVLGEPVVVAQAPDRPVPVGDFKNLGKSYFVGQSDSIVLVLVGTPAPGAWSLVRLRQNGDIIDTIPRQMDPLSSEYLGTAYGVTWEAPYFYLWEGGGGYLSYRRILEDLTIVDAVPRRLCDLVSGPVLKGAEAWMIDANRSVRGYTAIGDSLILKWTAIDAWPPITGLWKMGALHNGIYAVRRNSVAHTIELAHVSPTGEVTALTDADHYVYPSGGHLFSSDSVVFWAPERDVFPSRFQWFFMSPSDTLSGTVLHSVIMPVEFRSGTHWVAISGDTAVIFGNSLETPVNRWFTATIDLRTDSLLGIEYLGIDNWPGDNVGSPRLALAGQAMLAFFIRYSVFEELVFPGPNASAPLDRKRILFGRGHVSQPTVLCDSTGILVYAMEGHEGGTRLTGYRWIEFDFEGMENPTRLDPFPDDSDQYAPSVIGFGDRKGLFWSDRRDDSLGIRSNEYTYRLNVFSGDEPDPGLQEQAYVIDTTWYQEPGENPASAVQIGETLYTATVSAAMTSWLQSVDLVSQTKTPFRKAAWSWFSPILLRKDDTLVCVSMLDNCVRSCGNIGCCVVDLYLSCSNFMKDAPVNSWQDYLPGQYNFDDSSFPWARPVLRPVQGARGNVFTLSYPPAVVELDLAKREVTAIVELLPHLSIPIGAEYDIQLYAAFVEDYLVVFAFGNKSSEHDAFVFNSQRELIEHSTISIAGSEHDIGGIVPIPGTDTLLVVYSAWLPYPYSSERLVVQKVWLDMTTGIGEGQEGLPQGFRVEQNYPNPFNADTEIRFSLPRRAEVTVEIFNVLGQLIRHWRQREYKAGEHAVHWDGKDESGQEAATGVYMYRVKAEGEVGARKMLLLR